MDIDQSKVLEQLQGKWVAYADYHRGEQKTICIEENRITFPTFYNGDVTAQFVIEKSRNIAGVQYYEITATSEKGVKSTFLFGEELIKGNSVCILFETSFEYDGRGLIVMNEYVSVDQVDKMDADYKSNLHKHLNERPVPSMRIDMPFDPSNPAPAMGNMMDLMNGMNMMALFNGNINSNNNETTEKVTCKACGNLVQAGKFCGECGAILSK